MFERACLLFGDLGLQLGAKRKSADSNVTSAQFPFYPRFAPAGAFFST